MKLTPVLIADDIKTSLPFWVDRMGFTNTAEAPGFCILVRGGVELMLQSKASVLEDEPKFAYKGEPGSVVLFVEVDDFEDILHRLIGYPITMAERVTSYKMREIGVREPSGHPVIFAKAVNTPA